MNHSWPQWLNIKTWRWTPTLRLTSWYLAIIVVLSLAFSVVQYRVASRELGAGLRRQANIFEQLPGFYAGPGTYNLPDQQSEQSRHNLVLSLVLVNLGILVAGGYVSYWLAKRTLQPIEDALEAQSRFAADASHELRTPLTAMKSEIEVGLRDAKLSSTEAKTLLESNLEEVAKLEALTNGLLKLARQDADLPDAPVDLAVVAELAADRLAKQAQQRKVKFKRDVPSLTITGDQASLVELMVVLIDNAIKYSPSGSTITIGGRAAGRAVQLWVRDEGQGIKALDIPHVFDRFYRADTSRSRERIAGYGLGLSIARQITTMHGGTIGVESVPGQGSLFSITLPRRRHP